jgi:hypothetical protein
METSNNNSNNIQKDLDKLESIFKTIPSCSDEKLKFINKFLSLCDPNDLMYLSKKLDEFKCDFVNLLPIEIVEIILRFLDIESLISCCQVCQIY